MTSRATARVRTRLLGACLALAMAGATPRVAAAHELEQASVALVVRADGLVEMRLMVPWGAVLHTELAPRLDAVRFLTQLVNQSPATFARTIATLEAQIARDLRLLNGGARVGFERWQWPAAASIQSALREELMSRIAEGANFRHASRLAATATARVTGPATEARLAVPAMLGPVLLTVTHPVEQLVPSGAVSAPFLMRR